MKKIITLALVLATVFTTVFCATSCSKAYDFDKETELVMATNAAFPPYEYVDGGEYYGIDVEIAKEIAKRLNKTLRIEDIEFDSIIGGIESGKYDMALAGLTVTAERQKSVSFSDSYANGVQIMIVRKDSAYTSIDDFFNYDAEGNPVSLKKTDVKIGVQKTTTGDIYASSDVTGWGFNDLKEDGSTETERVTRYNNGADAVEALKTGKVDVVIIDNEPAKAFVNANPNDIRILETEYTNEDYAIAVNKDSKVLLDKINETLAAMKADGTLDAIIKKYIPAQ
ncbi:MAG: transporter substrate-binding domain-containing protein [Clostridia bacterium]|nr:transporter substrate-binding domain-containing protein [Clostridia bacterium]